MAKKPFAVLMGILLLFCSMGAVYAENAATAIDNTESISISEKESEITEKSEFEILLAEMEQKIGSMGNGDEIIIEAYCKDIYTATPLQNIEWTDYVKMTVLGLFEEFYTKFNSSIKRADVSEIEKKLSETKNGEAYDYYTNVSIGKNQYICMKENYIITPWCAGEIENPKAVVEFFEDFVDGYIIFDIFEFPRKNVFYTVDADIESQTYKGAEFEYLERLTFDIAIDESFRATPFAEAGTPGSKINCTVERLVPQSGKKIFFLTAKGNIGKKQFFLTIDRLNPLTNDYIEFDSGQIYENKQFITYKQYGSGADYQIQISGSSKDGEITDVKIQLCRKPINFYYPSISATNIKYEYIDDVVKDSGLNDLFDITKEQILSNNPEKQDPENYKTELKTWDDNGNELYGYYINFIGMTKAYPNIKEQYAPSWLKELGSGIKITIVGITQTLEGKDRMNYTMIRFAGSKGVKWFDMSSLSANDVLLQGNYTSENPLEVDTSYSSLKFFDGFSKIKNTLSNDRLNGKIRFINDGELTVDSFVIDLGTQNLELKADDLIFIGGGKATYENFWKINF